MGEFHVYAGRAINSVVPLANDWVLAFGQIIYQVENLILTKY